MSDISRILLRATIGTTMIVHGVRHAQTLAGTSAWFRSIGFREPELQAKASAVVEIGAGAALLAGAATPLATAAVVGTMGVAARSVHARNGFFITAEGYEYVLNLTAASVALSALGPGRRSIDAALGRTGRARDGLRRALFTSVLGAGAAAAQLALFWRGPEESS